MVSLDQLESAFAQVERIGRPEHEVRIGDIKIIMRPISDEEQVQAFKYANVAFEDGTDDGATQQDFIHRMKVSVLGYAIVQFMDLDLRDKFVYTGEETNDGRPIKREKAEVVRSLISQWPLSFVSRAFAKFGEIETATEILAEKLIQYDPVDIETEIERLEARISELREQLKGKDKIDAQGMKVKETIAQQVAMQRAESVQTTEAPRQSEQPSRPQQQPEPQPQYQERDVQTGRSQHQQVQQMIQEEEEEMESSFLGDDPEAEIRAQNARILARKKKQMEEHAKASQERQRDIEARNRVKQRRARESNPPIRPAKRGGGRVPPHAAAANTARKVSGMDDEKFHDENVKKYRMPAQTISQRGAERNVSENEPVPVNPKVQGTRNNRFVSPKDK